MPVQIISNQPPPDVRATLIVLYGDEAGAAMFDYLETCDAETREGTLKEILIKGKQQLGEPVPQSWLYNSGVVDPEKFFRDPYFLGMENELYPTVVPHLIEINSGKYVELVATGGVGSAKTTIGLLTCAYQIYLLSMMKDPHGAYGISRADEIEFIFQSLTARLAESVDYARFKTLIYRSPYFSKEFPPDPDIKSELRFPNRIIVKPVSGSNLATLGQNVMGGLVDELNYMATVEKSKKSVDQGAFNQAIEVYNSISRRRISRFYKQGFMPGILCLVSSKKYPGQFTDKKTEERAAEIREKGRSAIYLYDKTMWDIKPDSFSKTRFRVFTGDEFRKPRILADNERVPKGGENLIIEVPDDPELKKAFSDDIVNALRELAGVSHVTKSPFFTNREILLKAFTKRKSVFTTEWTDFDSMELRILKKISNPEIPRFAHVDLGVTGDSAGVAIGHCPGFVEIPRGDTVEKLPEIVYDGVLEVRPPKNGEILFWRIRRVFYILKMQLGMNLRWISYDSYQSVDSLQILKGKGFVVGVQSIDEDMGPANFFKGAVIDGRIDCPMHQKAFVECRDVQVDLAKGKVDHLPTGSKDIFDAMVGVCFGLTTRTEVWAMYNVPIIDWMIQAVKKAKGKEKAPTESRTGSAIIKEE